MTISLIKPAARSVGWAAAINTNFTTIEEAIEGLDVPLRVYGDGSDGDVEITSNTTLTRPMFYRTLTVTNNAVLTTAGLQVYASESITVASGATIRNNGSDGTGSAGGTGGAAFNLGGGGDGGWPSFSGSDSFSAYGGNGGTGTAGGGVVNPPNASIGTIRTYPQAITGYLLAGDSGGGFNEQVGGGAGGGGGSGGGGGGGGVILLASPSIANSGTIEAKGGNGNGTGAGGGGGVVLLVYGAFSGSAASVAAGTGGSGAAAGTVFQITP